MPRTKALPIRHNSDETNVEKAMKKLVFALFLLAAWTARPSIASAEEASCNDGTDEDGDTVTDCADADCFDDPVCKPDGQPENSNQRCGDWVDNDEDGQIDCDDSDCFGYGITVCEGSYDTFKRQQESGGTATDLDVDIPQLGAGMTVEDLIGTGSDADGERNDLVCADGIDNDNDGRVDCADFGCRFDPEVTVCQGEPDFRFSLVARAAHTYAARLTRRNTRFGMTLNRLPCIGCTLILIRAVTFDQGRISAIHIKRLICLSLICRHS